MTNPFKEIKRESTVVSDVQNIILQNNYSNVILGTIANQLNRVEDIVQTPIQRETMSRSSPLVASSSSTPLFKPFEFLRGTQVRLSKEDVILK